MPKKNIRKIVNAESYKINHNDKFFFDANVWISILNRDNNQDLFALKAQSFLKKIHEKGAKIYLCPELVSEIFNRLAKMRQQKSTIIGYKDFRKSPKYQEWVEDFSDQFSQLIKNGDIIFVNSSIDSATILTYFQSRTKDLDFKDFIYEELCCREGLICVTNDKDFASSVGRISKLLSFNQILYNKPF